MSTPPQKMFWFGSYTDKHKHTKKASGFDYAVSSKRTDDKSICRVFARRHSMVHFKAFHRTSISNLI